MFQTRSHPQVTSENEHFWHGGAEGQLRFLRCQACHFWLHQPTPSCSRCLSRNVAPEASSGRGTVASFTVNMHTWQPAMPPPYVIAIAERDDQEGLRVTTRPTGNAPEEVAIGPAVQAVFQRHGVDARTGVVRGERGA